MKKVVQNLLGENEMAQLRQVFNQASGEAFDLMVEWLNERICTKGVHCDRENFERLKKTGDLVHSFAFVALGIVDQSFGQ